MKKLIIILIITLTVPVFLHPLNAALMTDISGTYISLGDEGSVYGAGLSFLWDMPRYLDDESILFYINSTFAYSVEDKDKISETVRTYVPVSAGIEYRYQVLRIPLYVTGSAGAGISYFEKQGPAYFGPYMDPSKTQIDSTFGPYADFMLGVNYVLSQNAAFFARGGYQVSFYDEDNIESPSGFQITAGMRIPISGSFRSFD